MTKKRTRQPLEAEDRQAQMRICGACDGFTLEAADAADAGVKLRKFSMIAYTGALMKLPNFPGGVVADLAGMSVPAQTRPILRDHDPAAIVGHTEKIDIDAKQIKVSGVISGVGIAAQEVSGLASNGFPWEASIGATIERLEFVERGQTVKVNGRTFPGPVHVARETTLREISFVAIGADHGGTSVSVAASQTKKGETMFETWLTAHGWDAASLSDTQRSVLQSAFEREQAAKVPVVTPPVEDPIAERRKIEAAESARIGAIRKVCAAATVKDAPIDGQGEEVNIEAHAIAEGWDLNRTKLELMRAERPKQQQIHGRHGGAPATPQIIEAALCMSRGLKVDGDYPADVLQEAHSQFRGRMGLQETILTIAAQNGFHCSPGQRIHSGNIREILTAASGLQAAFSTVTLPGVFGNVANKDLLAGYMEEDQTWREVAQIRSVVDFKQATSYRMLDSLEYEEVGPGGEIKHGTLSEESYTRQARTYAKMVALTRQDIINDDLGAFDDIRNRIGRGAAQKLNNVFWTEFMSDAATFWTAARGNYITGATTTLDSTGLGLAVKAFRQMKSPTADGGKRLGGRPAILLVPPELESIARQLFVSQNLKGDTDEPDANIFVNLFRPIVSPWLSDAAFPGNSTTAWYLLREPSLLAVVVVSFLNGQQSPTVESADVDFNMLGIQFRGYHDFGCDQAEYKAGVKSKGAA